MKITDRELVNAIYEYRQDPAVDNRHGPVSLESLGHWVCFLYDHVGEPMVKGSLSPRVKKLCEEGYLDGKHDEKGVLTFSLYVTDKGMELLENEE